MAKAGPKLIQDQQMIFSAVEVEVAWILLRASRNAASHRGPPKAGEICPVAHASKFPTDSQKQNGEYLWLNVAGLSLTIDQYEQEFKGMTAN